MTLDVFFSYASEDSLLVRRIRDGIESRTGGRVDIYIYEEDPRPGTSITRKAKRGIRDADLFLVLLTPNSEGSAWVQQEVGFADGVNCPIVPVLLESADVSGFESLLGDVEYLVYDRDDPEAFFEAFLQSVDIDPPVENGEDVTGRWYLGTATGTVLWTLYLLAAILMAGVPSESPTRNVLGVLGLLSMVMPVATYFDIRHVEDHTSWRPATLLWVLTMAIWLINGLPGAMYLYRRHVKTGRPGSVVTYTVAAVVAVVFLAFTVRFV